MTGERDPGATSRDLRYDRNQWGEDDRRQDKSCPDDGVLHR